MMNADYIEFWFDFSSPYAFFAAREINKIAAKHKMRAVWQPFLLGAAFKATGMQSLSKTPIRGDYARHDWQRLARRANVPFQIPPFHPILSLPGARLFYWLEARDEGQAVEFARRAFDAYFLEGIDMSQADIAICVASKLLPYDAETLAAGMSSKTIKDKLCEKTNEAIERGVFGAPFFFVNDEPFWGADRLQMLDEWIEAGGW